jgi:hypothetical protein
MTLFNRLASMFGMTRPPAHISVTPTAVEPHVIGPVVIPAPAFVPAVSHARTGPTIAIINKSKALTDAEVKAVIPAMQVQIDRDFAPIWELDATLTFLSASDTVPANVWTMYLLDNSDQSGALGYHDITDNGLPTAKVFAGDDKQYNLSWTVTLSHELLEMLLDPYINTTVFVQQTDTTGVLFAYEVCFTGDTLIPLLDGTSVPIKDLTEREKFSVYSITKDGKIAAGNAHSCRKTRENAEIVKVMLDSDESFRCTPDHRIMMRDGSYKKAVDLVSGDSLMPLYRREHEIANGGKHYEQVLDMESGEWKFTHRVVQPRCPTGYVRHHANFNRFDNSPENLILMKWDDHKELHQSHIREVGMKWNKEALANGTHPFQRERTESQRDQAREQMISYNKSDAHRAKASEMGKLNCHFLRSEMAISKVKELNSKRMSEYNKTEKHKKVLEAVFASDEFKAAASSNAKLQNHKRWHEKRNMSSDSCEHCTAKNNHKVISVEYCGNEDVYDFTVDKFHNFALEAGVFVHNCDAVEDDMFGYKINNVLVSDFVYPSWFEAFRAQNSTQFSYGNHVHSPFEIAQGGYIGYFEVSSSQSGWQQATGQNGPGQRLMSKIDRSDSRIVNRKNHFHDIKLNKLVK